MSDVTFQIVGVALIVIGVAEFVIFRLMATRNETIAKRLPLLSASALFNVLLGGGVLAWATMSR